MFATGRVPNTGGIGLDKAGVEWDAKGAIVVDEDSRSTCPSIYAVGDVTNRMQITRVAIREGQALDAKLFGTQPTRVNSENVPREVFSPPTLAVIVMTPSQGGQHSED